MKLAAQKHDDVPRIPNNLESLNVHNFSRHKLHDVVWEEIPDLESCTLEVHPPDAVRGLVASFQVKHRAVRYVQMPNTLDSFHLSPKCGCVEQAVLLCCLILRFRLELLDLVTEALTRSIPENPNKKQ